MISKKHKCIFIEVPKTGSTSIRSVIGYPPKAHLDLKEISAWLDKNLPYMDTPAYKYANILYTSLLTKKYKQGKGNKVLNNYFKFGFVRNPWSRTVSLYLRKQGIQMKDKMSFDEFVDWIQYSSDTCKHPSQKLNQLDWFKDESGKVNVDFIGRFENIEQDWSVISKKLNIDTSLPHINHNTGAERKHYTDYYTSKTKEIIKTKFIADIEYFGYKFK